jgi:hypothetical protein
VAPAHDPFRIWEVLGTWAAAVATFAAVIVSLRLARRAERPRLRVSVDHRLLLDPAKFRDRANVRPDEMRDMVYFEAVNVGMTRVRINSVGWHWFLIREIGALQNPPERTDRSHDWPAILEHGDELQWILPFDLVNNLAEKMLASSWWWRVKLRLMCIIVSTSTGDSFRAPVGPELRRTFAKAVKRIRASRAAEHRP